MKGLRASRVAGVVMMLIVGFVGSGCEPPVATDQAGPTAAESTSGESPALVPASSSTPIQTSTQTESGPQSATLVAVVDGDTLETSMGTVRLIGIDTPERAQCGHEEASAAIGGLLSAGDRVALELPEGQNDRDQYDRLLRYVGTADGVDLGMVQLHAGNAIARYDSTDGYPWHPREATYHAAQLASPDQDGSVITTSCQASALVSIAPVVEGTDAEVPWWTQYSSCTKLKKNTVGHPKGPFRKDDPDEADIYDWFENGTGHHGDGDNDGLACE